MTSEVQEINQKLIDHYGLETESNNPIYRIVWSDEEYEYRASDVTANGIKLLQPQIQYLPKYNYIVNRWILEKLVLVPEWQQRELGGIKKSYEPLFVFQNAHDGTYLPAKWEAAAFAIDCTLAATGKVSLAKYKEMLEKDKNKEARLNELQEQLFGDESSLEGRTITGEAVAYTGPSKVQ